MLYMEDKQNKSHIIMFEAYVHGSFWAWAQPMTEGIM